MKRIAALLMCVILFTVLVSCNKHETEADRQDSASIVPSSEVNYKLNGFDGALIAYLCLNGYNSSDFLISPAALRAALCLAASGAQGNTRAELVSAAGFSGMNAFDAWYLQLNDSDSFSAASSVWCDSSQLGEFSDSFKSNAKAKYNADACAYGTDELTQAINDWISKKTDGTIQSVAENTAGGASVLVNTLHLQSAWKNVFSEEATYESVFVDADGNERPMSFMEQTGEYLYAEDGGTKILAIPMEGNLSFVCFLGTRTDRFEKMTGLQSKRVHAVLPKFELESAFDAKDLLGFLLSRGVNDAINSKTANFYNMCTDSDWFIQEILQKTTITVDEKGIGSVKSRAKPGAEATGDADIKEFVADRPFSFAIFSDFGANSQNMLFYGQMMTVD